MQPLVAALRGNRCVSRARRVSESTPSTKSVTIQGLPVLPLRDVVVYPHMVIPLFVGREKSIHALDVAMKADKRIMLIAQKQPDVDDPKADDL
jgi:ATP-dependent Lon protease